MSKRILIFSTAYLPFIGGAEIAVKEITDRLSGEYEFDLITARLDGSLPKVEKIGEVTVYRIGIGVPILDKLAVPFLGAIKALFLHKRRSYKAFWAIMATFASGAGYLANSLRKAFGRKKIPMILTLQEGDSEEHLTYNRGGLISISWYLALKRTDTLTAISNYLLKRAKGMGFVGRSFLIPNGVNVKYFQLPTPDIEQIELRKELGMRDSDVLLITTSRLTKKNSVEDIIKSLQYLPSNVKFLILGVGEEEASLKRLAKDAELEERVRFLGLVRHADIPKYLNACDIFVRPSLSEGMGNSFIEAMASGIPVIATPVGGITDFLKDGVTGLFCEVKNPESIAKKVKEYLENPALREQIIINAKKMVMEKYDWDMVASDMKNKVFSML